jgi:hypothetical protein
MDVVVPVRSPDAVLRFGALIPVEHVGIPFETEAVAGGAQHSFGVEQESLRLDDDRITTRLQDAVE